MEEIIVTISSIINLISIPYLIYRVGVIDREDCDIRRFVIEIIIFAVALAVTVRYTYCLEERKRR